MTEELDYRIEARNQKSCNSSRRAVDFHAMFDEMFAGEPGYVPFGSERG